MGIRKLRLPKLKSYFLGSEVKSSHIRKGSTIMMKYTEEVNDFNCLGLVLSYTGSFTLNNQYVVGKAMKVMRVLYNNICKHSVNPKISLELVDAFANPIINFGCQTRGFTKAKELGRIH